MQATSLSLQAGRFAGVGGLATLVHIALAYVAHATGTVSPVQANIIGFVGGVAVSYLGNFYWTFPGDASRHAASLPRFVVLSGVNLLWSTLVVGVTQAFLGWSFIAALGVILITAPPLSFLVSKFWVFEGQSRRSGG